MSFPSIAKTDDASTRVQRTADKYLRLVFHTIPTHLERGNNPRRKEIQDAADDFLEALREAGMGPMQ